MCIGSRLAVNRNYAALLLGILAVSTVHAQDSGHGLPRIGDRATSGSTYGDLIAMALPGARATGDEMVLTMDGTVPHIDGPEFAVTLPAPAPIVRFQPVALSVDDRPHLALLIELAVPPDSLGPIAALALFDIAQSPRLVDVVDVGFDRQVSFAAEPTFAVGAGHDLLLVHNSHGNAGQFYDAITVLDVTKDALVMVDQIMTLNTMDCEGTRTQYAEFVAAAPDDQGSGDFTVSVLDVREPPLEGCTDIAVEVGETRYAVDYRWDAASGRYLAQGDGWAAFDAMNAARF